MTNLLPLESAVAETTTTMISRMSEMAQSDQVINLQMWLQFFAFDAIGTITVGVLRIIRTSCP